MRAECAEEAGNTGRFDAGTLARMEGLVDRIREVMELRGWTAYEFAHRAQLSDSILSNWLRRGVKRPDIEALNKLAAAAGVPCWCAWARLKMSSVHAMLRAA